MNLYSLIFIIYDLFKLSTFQKNVLLHVNNCNFEYISISQKSIMTSLLKKRYSVIYIMDGGISCQYSWNIYCYSWKTINICMSFYIRIFYYWSQNSINIIHQYFRKILLLLEKNTKFDINIQEECWLFLIITIPAKKIKNKQLL